MWLFSRKGPSGFSACSTAEEVTQGIDGTGLTAIVTGASSGIGIETARVLALRGVHVLMAVRNLPAGRDVKGAIVKEIPSAKVDVMELDLSSMASVRKFASEFNSLDLPLNILINNAGVMATPFMLSQDGIELQFATNHLDIILSDLLAKGLAQKSLLKKKAVDKEHVLSACHFLLTDLLLGTMKSTAQKSNVEGRVVNLSSDGHKLAYREGIRFDKINDKSGYNSIYAYGQSKLANILHANELTRRLKEEGVKITANSLHPGAIVTNLLRHHSFLNGIATALGKYVLKNVPQGAATTCYVALHPQVEGVSGKFFRDSNVASPSAHATNVDLAKKLWEFSLSLVHPNPPSLSTPNL